MTANAGCNCCRKPPYDPGLIVHVATGISKNKIICGYSPYPFPQSGYGPKTYYRTVRQGGNILADYSDPIDPADLWKRYRLLTIFKTGSSSSNSHCSATGSLTQTYQWGRDTTNNLCIAPTGRSSCSGTATFTCTDSNGNNPATEHYDCAHPDVGDNLISYATISDPDSLMESTEDLKDRAISALPAYSTNFDEGAGVAFQSLSTNETSFSLSRFKWKLQHRPTPTCFLEVWFQKIIQTVADDGITNTATAYEDLGSYVWHGSGTPCFTDSSDGTANGYYYSPVHEQLETETNNENVSVRIKKWSCLEGYIPANPNDDGSRPSPDHNSNGFPT